ncbi:MAG: phosphatidylserine decarboxylase [Acidobacteriota bacterium]|jgi:phosphatidylserine decarboxylase
MHIRSEALPYALPGAVAAAVAAAAGRPWFACALTLLAVALGAFFRDPERSSDAPTGAVLSPADGRVVEVRSEGDGLHLAIFLSVFNVHVTRAPLAGDLRVWERIAGGYAMAFRAAASHNARHRVVVETAHGSFELALIAGAVARRVVPFVAPPETLQRGQRIALIKFGSRAELHLPAGYSAVVSVGDRVRAGTTVVAAPSSGTP